MKSNKSKTKKLYIVRHAKSSWNHPHLSDFERPLNNRGENDAPDMGQRLVAEGIQPSIMISSPAARAITTAKVISQKLGYFFSRIVQEEGLYHASSYRIRQIISQSPDSENVVMVFGHNPGLTDLINEISDFDLDNLPTCAVCGIEFEMESWKEIQNKRGHKFYYD